MCKIGEAVVVGGVRRSAMISLSNVSDDRMRLAKLARGTTPMDSSAGQQLGGLHREA